MPIVTEMVAAGFPSPALDGREEGFSLDAHVIEHPEYTFIVTVAGDSMEGAGIFHGDWLVVDRSLTPEDGDVVVAVLDGELTVKRLLSRDGRPHAARGESPLPRFRPLRTWGCRDMGRGHGQFSSTASVATEITGLRW